MKTRILLLAFLAAGLIGCAHTLAPGAEMVAITKKEGDVKGCRVVGPVSFSRTQKDAALMNHVYGMGADTLFLTRHDDRYRYLPEAAAGMHFLHSKAVRFVCVFTTNRSLSHVART